MERESQSPVDDVEYETDSPVVGVDILFCPVEDIAPEASQVPLPEFGCQGIDIPGSPQDPSGGRDIPGSTQDQPGERDIPGSTQDQPGGRDAPSLSSHSTTSEIPSDASDKSVELHPPGPVVVRAPKGSVGIAILDKRRR